MSRFLSGPNTSRYKVVQGHFYPLVLHFEQDLAKIAAILFEKELITSTSCGEASNSNQPSFDRSSALLRKVLKKIEVDESFYDTFFSVLRELGELAHITNALEDALQKELAITGNATVARVHFLPKHLRRQNIKRVTRPASWQGVDFTNLSGGAEKYLKSQTAMQATVITNLKQTIYKLQQKEASFAEKLKQQGIIVSLKDGQIEDLKRECDMKDEHVTGLQKNKAKMEKTIKDLEEKCSQAELKQVQSTKEIKRLQEAHREQIEGLQKELDEVQMREKIAQIDLAKAKAKLAEAMLEKEREISKLREEFFRQEKTKHELQISKLKLEEEKKVEAILKEKELAMKDKELAIKDMELAMKEKELAQEKEKRAQDVVRRVNVGRRRVQSQVEGLEREIEKLRGEDQWL